MGLGLLLIVIALLLSWAIEGFQSMLQSLLILLGIAAVVTVILFSPFVMKWVREKVKH